MFETVNEIARWRMVYNGIRGKEKGTILTYEELSEYAKTDVRADRSPVLRAIKELERQDQMTLINVRGQGYRVAEPMEHLGEAKKHHRKSKRQMTTAVRKVASANRSGLSQDEIKRLDNMEMVLRRQGDMISRLADRTERNEEALKAMRRDTKSEIASMNDKIEQLQRLVKDHKPSDV